MSTTIAQQIRAARVRMKHTQASLAAAIGVHSMTVSKWERGTARPHRVFIEAILRLLADHQEANA